MVAVVGNIELRRMELVDDRVDRDELNASGDAIHL